MITILTTIFAWALKNQVIAGGVTLIAGKVYTLFEEWFKRKYFPEKQEVVIQKVEQQTVKKKVASQKKTNFALSLLIFTILLLGSYVLITIWSFQFMKSDSMKLEAIEQMKLIIILCVAFFLAKLVSFTTTLEEIGKMLPFIKSFIKK